MTSNLYRDLSDTEPSSIATPQRVLAIGAHPDDIEFGAGGTLAKWAIAGAHVAMLVMTDGSKGTWDPSVSPRDLAQTRRAEQSSAAAALGAAEVIHLDHIDGELEYSMALRREICAWIRTVKPGVLLSHDPWQRYQLHPDHRAAGLAAVDGMVAARDHLFFPELELAPHRPDAMLLWSADVVDHWEDIATTVDRKIDALLCHSSQGTTTMGGAETDSEKQDAFRLRIGDWAARQGAPAGLVAAEAFKRLRP